MNCAMCKAGLVKGIVNHIVDLEGQIIIVKNVPANLCKQCGESFIEHTIALQLEEIIEQAKRSRAEFVVINYHENVA